MTQGMRNTGSTRTDNQRDYTHWTGLDTVRVNSENDFTIFYKLVIQDGFLSDEYVISGRVDGIRIEEFFDCVDGSNKRDAYNRFRELEAQL